MCMNRQSEYFCRAVSEKFSIAVLQARRGLSCIASREKTGVSAVGSTSRSRTPDLGQCETVRLDRAHVDDSRRGSGRREMVQVN